MTGKVYIHVGLEKTGSTYLQSVIGINEELLESNDMKFLRAGRESGHHYWVAKALNFKYQDIAIDPTMERKALEELTDEVEEAAGRTLLLSSEHFDFNVDTGNTTRLVKMFPGREVHIIMVLRNQVDYSRSLYIEHLKWGGLRTYGEFIRHTIKQKRYNFLRRYRLWQEAGARVTVIDYSSGRLLKDFLGAIELSNLTNILELPPSEQNVTPSIDLMEFVRLVNQGLPPANRRGNYEKIVHQISSVLPDLLKKRDFPIPPIAREIFMQEEANNYKLASILDLPQEHFLGGPIIDRLKDCDLALGPDIRRIVDHYFS